MKISNLKSIDYYIQERRITMEDLIIALVVSVVVAFMASNIIAMLYNVFIGIPKGHKIKKSKKYKTVTATLIVRGTDESRELLYGESSGNHKNVFKYEWEVDGKVYRRSIRTATWPSAVDTFYYLNNPKYAMPDPVELANFKHTKGLFLIFFIVVFLVVISK